MTKKSKSAAPAAPVGAPQGSKLPPRLATKKASPTEVYEHKLLKKDQYPLRARTALPDQHPDLDEKAKAKLGLWPYDSNIVCSKLDLVALQNFYLEIRDIPLPNQVLDVFEKQHNLLRKILQLVPLEDIEPLVKSNIETYQGPKRYQCKCFKGKK
jgi:hypothetical protein